VRWWCIALTVPLINLAIVTINVAAWALQALGFKPRN
jgi:hypothetical protein